MQTRKRKSNMLQINSIAYSPNKGRNDLTTNKLTTQIKALLETNRYLEATLAKKVAESCKLETKGKTLLANNRHLAKTLTKKIAETCELENKGLLYENLKLESRVSIKAIEEHIMIIESRLQNILSELTTWLSNFSLVRNLTNEAKEEICLFLTLLDSKSDAFSKQELFPDSLKSSKKKIKLLETVKEDVETPSSVYLKKRRNDTSHRNEDSKKKINYNNNASKPKSTFNREKSKEINTSIDSVYDYVTLNTELAKTDHKPIKQEICELNDITETCEDALKNFKTISAWLDVQNKSRKLRPRKPVNYLEVSESPVQVVHKTLTHSKSKGNKPLDIKSEIVTKTDKKKISHKSEYFVSDYKNCQQLPVSVKTEVISQSEQQLPTYHRINEQNSLQDNCSSMSEHFNEDFLYPSTLTHYEKQHKFNKYIPCHFTNIEDGQDLKETYQNISSRRRYSKKLHNFTLSSIVEDISTHIKDEVVSPEEDNIEDPKVSRDALLSETENLLEYSAWLRDLG